MIALAAARLGYDVHIRTPEEDSPAARVAARATVGDWADEAAFSAFVEAVDVVTLEFENVPVDLVERIAAMVPVRPGPGALRIAQDRRLEKAFLERAGIPVAAWRPVDTARALPAAAGDVGFPCLLKSARLGYDGKGQVPLDADTDMAAAWQAMGGEAAIVEARVDFACEISVIVARMADGAMATWDPAMNRHVDRILHTSTAPAPVDPGVTAEALGLARGIATALEIVGLVAVEMFVTRDNRILVNEIAPRPHNSGHWTMDACATCQFEQLVRAVCGLPPGPTERHADAVMTNLIGEDAAGWPGLLAEPGARLHLYGKREARPGRKMGHVTRLSPRR